MYGAREILLDYAGLSRNLVLLGVLQHGIGSTPEIRNNVPSPRIYLRRSPVWIASKRSEIELKQAGFRYVKAIGSAWSYMNKLSEDFPTSEPSERRDVLFFARHYGGTSAAEYSNQEILKIFSELSARYPNSSLTVCVYFTDLLTANWHDLATRFGIEVVSAGVGVTSPAWRQSESRIKFLYNVKKIIGRHNICLFDEPSSAIFYALSLGKIVKVEPIKSVKLVDYQLEFQRWFQSNLPKILSGIDRDPVAEEITNELLGNDLIMSRENLQDTLRVVPLLNKLPIY